MIGIFIFSSHSTLTCLLCAGSYCTTATDGQFCFAFHLLLIPTGCSPCSRFPLLSFLDPSLPLPPRHYSPPSRKPSLTNDPPSPRQPLYKPPCRDWLQRGALSIPLHCPLLSKDHSSSDTRPGPQEKGFRSTTSSVVEGSDRPGGW